MASTVRLVGPRQRAHAKHLVDEAPDGYVMKLGAETRRDAQNRKLWPMLQDVRNQLRGFAAFSLDDMKLRFLNALGAEMRFLPALESEGMFPVGLKSSTLTVQQFAGLIELIYAFGAKHGVRWTDPAQGIEARSGETPLRLDPQDESPVAKRCAQPSTPSIPRNSP